METTQVLISSPIGVLAVLAAVAAFFFLLAQLTKAKLFNFLPPLLFIYATPVFLSNLSVAIASAANIGAAASAPIVAAHHRPNLVPASILLALLGYAMGNYLAPLTGHLARIAVGQ